MGKGYCSGGATGKRTFAGSRICLAAVLFLSFTLRGPVSSVGPLVDEVQTELRLSAAMAASLVSLPLICWGILSPLAPALAHRLGLHAAVLTGSAILLAGVALRTFGVVGLFAGTVLVGAGIAVNNVLLAAVVKNVFAAPLVPLVTGLVLASMTLSASLGAALAQPIRVVVGDPLTSLAVWLIPTLIGLTAWLAVAEPRLQVFGAPRVLAVLRDRLALGITAFFGLQSLAFYTMLAWLPQILRDAGQSPSRAGTMVAAAAFLGLPASFVLPRLAVGQAGQRPWVVLVAVPSAAGLLGLLVAPQAAPWVWSLLFGLGTASTLPLAFTLMLQRTRDSADMARLSAAAQSVGYLLAAGGPIVVGLLHQLTGGWHASLLLLLSLLAVQTLVGLRASSGDRLVGG